LPPSHLSGGGVFALEKALKAGGQNVRRCYDELFQVGDLDKARCRVVFTLPERETAPFGSIRMEKRYHLRKDTLTVAYTLSNGGGAEAVFRFIPTVDLSFAGDGEKHQRVFANGAALPGTPRTTLGLKAVEILKFQDLGNETILSLGSDKPFDGWIIPSYCPVPADPARDPSYQSTCVAPLYHVRLGPGESWTLGLSVKFAH
jgi:hypothetical protein